MEKTATLNIRINPDVKKSAEWVLGQLGVPMATAVDMFLKQVALTRGIPFAITLPDAPESINVELSTSTQIRDMIDEGLEDIAHGRVYAARDVFAMPRAVQ